VAEYLTFTPLMSDATLEPLRSVFDVERQSDRIEYTVRVSDQGSYQVNFYLLESWHSQAGDRTFTVSLQGVPVLSSIDLVQQVGFQVRAPRTQSSCPPLPSTFSLFNAIFTLARFENACMLQCGVVNAR
jgi:hypothetical protein